jgi:hypothetical protein
MSLQVVHFECFGRSFLNSDQLEVWVESLDLAPRAIQGVHVPSDRSGVADLVANCYSSANAIEWASQPRKPSHADDRR